MVFKKDDNPKTPAVEEQKSFSKQVLVKSGLPKDTDSTPGNFNASVDNYSKPSKSVNKSVTKSSSPMPKQQMMKSNSPGIQNVNSAPKRMPPPTPQRQPPAPPKPKLPQVKALYPYTASNEEELSFEVGDIITILDRDEGWLKGELNGLEGWIPGNYVEEI